MNIIFLTISRIWEIRSRNIYADLMRKFRDEDHHVYIVTPYERQFKLQTTLSKKDGVYILGVRTLNIQKTNVIEKGLGTILLETQFNNAIKKHLNSVVFDLILYSTPPITFTNVVKNLKKKNPQAVSYLLLKDIFPQNAVDLGMFSRSSLFYRYFRKKEIHLYRHSDYIGCMSPANVEFVIRHNTFISQDRVEVAPNSIELSPPSSSPNKGKIREKYHLPKNKPVFIYGGNLGKPQGIDFLIQCLEANQERNDCHFLIVGNGTEYYKIEHWFEEAKPQNMSLFPRLPKEDYDALVQSCDVGLIFLDHRFLIPNYPSRLLSYLEYKMPIIAATDVHTDIGSMAENNGYGYWCESNKVEDFTACVNKYVHDPESIREMGERGYRFLLDNYLVENTYQKIMSHIK
ncbi:glycosyltransferase family 4 protein [Odoribacter laneus]|uniref:Glycosyl transferase family 1 domain-containing protein n=1 Tax=Odoribacter laneus YIT 12061 TaxID=742817 RepID=H1DLD5_9BACT|nr:glycosyltransferase family 4 protein [Odoribacter laneus]EHP44963.1 hypothetical protein HMPREF9449_03071 [Odoribacter laneus YIT 12061]